MSELKCPICKRTLQPIGSVDTKHPTTNYYCPNNCIAFAFGNLPMWNELKRLHDNDKEQEQELIRTRKENEDKQAVLNCVVDMLKTLNQKYTLIMGKDVIKETVRLLEQNKGGDNE